MHDKNDMTLATHVQADLTLSDTPIEVKEVLQDRRISFTVSAAHAEATVAPFGWKETQVLKYVTTRWCYKVPRSHRVMLYGKGTWIIVNSGTISDVHVLIVSHA